MPKARMDAHCIDGVEQCYISCNRAKLRHAVVLIWDDRRMGLCVCLCVCGEDYGTEDCRGTVILSV